MIEFYTPNDFLGGSDSERIQLAIDAAAEKNIGRVVIPSYNKASDTKRWVIDKTILLPSDMTVILDNAQLIMAEGVMCRMFENSNATLPIGKSKEGEQKNINIIGVGKSVLDGGIHNGLTETTASEKGMPSIHNNITLYFHNVRDFRIENLVVRNQRWWGIEMIFSRYGQVKNIHFEIEYRDNYWKNQDGVDIRIGCNNILVENITGETGDDVIALTALNPKDECVEGKDYNIHDIVIRNVRAFCNECAIVRLLNHYGRKLYNITIDGVVDTSVPKETSRVGNVIRIGDDAYYQTEEQRAKLGDTYNISINNVFSRAMAAVHMEVTVKNLHVSNVFVHTDGQYGIVFGPYEFWLDWPIFMYTPDKWNLLKNVYLKPIGKKKLTEGKIYIDDEAIRMGKIMPSGLNAENVLIENIYYTAKCEVDGFTTSIIAINNASLKNVTLKNINCDENITRLGYAKRRDGEDEVEFI